MTVRSKTVSGSRRRHRLPVAGNDLRRLADRAKVLNIYAWSDIFPPRLIEKFQAETGIHVNYAVLDSPETAETRLVRRPLELRHRHHDASPGTRARDSEGLW